MEVGGERMYVIGCTEGGAPYGLSEKEFERGQDAGGGRQNWMDARDVLSELLLAKGLRPDRSSIGRIRFIGAGLSSAVYSATVQLGDREEAVVVKLPSRDAGPDRDERLRVEANLLRHLYGQSLPFRVPRPLGEIQMQAGLGVVQEWINGIAADLCAPRFPGGKPWELVALTAAAIHAVDPQPLKAFVRGAATLRDHATGFGAVLQLLDEPEAKDTEEFVRENLPPATPSGLLHGDLLGQNLLRSLESKQLAVIDWAESRLGDPAYDLAIITRGYRKPFATSDGLRRLVDAYNRQAATPLTVPQVHLYEVLLRAHLYRAAQVASGMRSPHAESQRSVWGSVLGKDHPKGWAHAAFEVLAEQPRS